MAGSSATRLAQIPHELRLLPETIGSFYGTREVRRLGAELVRESFELGAFRADSPLVELGVEIRHFISMKDDPENVAVLDGDEPDWKSHVWFSAVRIIAPDVYSQYDLDAISACVNPVADAIELEAKLLQGSARGATPPNEPIPDGPVPPDGFAYASVVHHGLARKPFLAVSFLWNRPNRTARYDELTEPVWGDREEEIPDHGISGLRREINRFFRQEGIPLHAKAGSGYFSLGDGQPGAFRLCRRNWSGKKPLNRG